MKIIYPIIFFLSMMFAVGYIEGGHHGIPINDNWIGFFVFTAIGLFFGILTIMKQAEEN
jgi:hypothetical protein